MQHVYWDRCVKSYNRDCGVDSVRGRTTNNNSSSVDPTPTIYKCIDIESENEMHETGILPQQLDDRIHSVVTCTDLTLEKTTYEQFSDDDTRFATYVIAVDKLIADGWIPMYDRGYVYWFPADDIKLAPEFNIRYVE